LTRIKKEKAFASEVALCAHFLANIKDDWTAYAETAGWDILLVRKADGFQIGIQAKLKLNAHVISQALEDGYSYSAEMAGPDCRAVLVPNDEAGAFDLIAAYIGFTIIRVHGPSPTTSYYKPKVFHPELPKITEWGSSGAWFENAPFKRHRLPEYVPDVPAGASAPIQLTNWKISAIKIAITLERRGFLTRADFKHHQIDYRRFIAREYGWLIATDGRYLVGPKFPDFKAQHPTVYEKIAADYSKWETKTPLFGSIT
jgi:hypothetical protein